MLVENSLRRQIFYRLVVIWCQSVLFYNRIITSLVIENTIFISKLHIAVCYIVSSGIEK